VVNDAGADVSHVVDEFHKTQLVTHDINGGLSAARNTGIRVADGKYITYLDDDDIWLPDHLYQVTQHLEILPWRVVYTDTYWWYQERYLVPERSEDFSRKGLRKKQQTTIISVALWKSCHYDKDIWFDEGLRYMEDWDYLLKMSKFYDFLHIHKATSCYSKRLIGDQITSDQEKIKEACDFIRKRHGINGNN
jgi:glycosyltransferase involved in cell wall biosynthesis